MVTTQFIATNTLVSNPRNARTHSKKQIRQIADSITAFGFVVPILIDCQQLLAEKSWLTSADVSGR